MGCTLSRTQDDGSESQQNQAADVFTFVPGLRIPKNSVTAKVADERLPSILAEKLLTKRAELMLLLTRFTCPTERESRRRSTDRGGPDPEKLWDDLKSYLSILWGFLGEGFQLSNIAEFCWSNQEDEIKATTLRSAHYELLSVLHLLGMLYLIEANETLTPNRPVTEGSQPRIFEERKKIAIEQLLKAAQVLECGLNIVLPQFPDDLKSKLPVDLQEGVLRALQLQALGQGVEIQLGLAIENAKATLAVKRRLACEGAKYWKQTQENLSRVHLRSDLGKKHALFVKWKYTEAKAAAYYYHGLILDESSEVNAHENSVACLQEADVLLKASQKNLAQFSAAPPITRSPLLWGAMVQLSEKIPRDLQCKVRVRREVHSERAPENLPDLPEFPPALKAEGYEISQIDDVWHQLAKPKKFM